MMRSPQAIVSVVSIIYFMLGIQIQALSIDDFFPFGSSTEDTPVLKETQGDYDFVQFPNPFLFYGRERLFFIVSD